MARYNPNVLPVESKRAVTFYPSGGSQEPYLHPHPIPSIHFISFLFIFFHFFLLMRSRGERRETVVEPGAALPRLLDELLPVGCGYGSRAPRHAANCRSGGAGRPPGEPRHEPSSQANGDAGRPPRTTPVRIAGSRDGIFYFLFLFFEFFFISLFKFHPFCFKNRFSKSLCKYFNQKFPP
jgi:hypothetical protein